MRRDADVKSLQAYYVIFRGDGSVDDAVPVELTESEQDAILTLMREAGLDECVRDIEADDMEMR
jgi:hypothetical protein